MSCEYCTDSDGEPCFPVYGVAPHTSFDADGKVIESVMLPPEEWPEGFTPDPEAPGHGTYHCAKCGDGKPDDPARAVAKRTIDALKQFAEDLKKGDLRGYHITRIERVNAFETVRAVINDPTKQVDEETG